MAVNMNQMRDYSISILERCLKLRCRHEEDPTKQPRLDELITTFEAFQMSPGTLTHAAGWHFCVPDSFRNALDIRLTSRKIDGESKMIWTQGPWFHFEAGDTIYDSPRAYLPWDLKNFTLCLDVKRASPARPPDRENPSMDYSGTVIFDVLTRNDTSAQLVKRFEHALTQDDFVKLLILGPPEDWLKLL
jgi:hypothetical protein